MGTICSSEEEPTCVYKPPIEEFAQTRRALRKSTLQAAKKWTGPSQIRYVIGVDFGTTYSGFGILKIPNFEEETPNIGSHTNWAEQTPGFVSPKVPSLLQYEVNADQLKPVLQHFGYAAKATPLSTDSRKAENIKIAIDMEVSLKRNEHREKGIIPKIPEYLSVTEVIADFLRELYVIMLQTIELLHSEGKPEKNEILFCFSIPIIWGMEHQNIMRNAILMAGYIDSIDSNLLTFCFEPEAAAATFFMEYTRGVLVPGTRALIVDAGGGTIDLFNCSLNVDGLLEQISVSDGCLYGGSLLDQFFTQWLVLNIGADVVEKLTYDSVHKETCSHVYGLWDHYKRTFHLTERDWLNGDKVKRITLPASFTKIIPVENQINLENDESLALTLEDMISIFDPVVDKIIDIVARQINSLKTDDDEKAVDYILLVGGKF